MPSAFSAVAAGLLAARSQLAPEELRAVAEQVREEIWAPLAHAAEGSVDETLHEALQLLDSITATLEEAAVKLDDAAEAIIKYLADTHTVPANSVPAITAQDRAPAPESNSVPHPATLPPTLMSFTRDAGWAQAQQAKLTDRPADTGPTTGLVYFGDNTEGVISSGTPPTPKQGMVDSEEDRGERELVTAAGLILANSEHFPIRIRGATLSAPTHVETKVATLMRQRGITYAAVVINNIEVCDGVYGCRKAVRAILPLGYTLVVWERGSLEPVTLKGKARP
ncbi:hypothetical protein GCM10022247_06980 [Allokutzneria multivorans]|uniref:SCP1.201-like deaminase n=1 Tax=Allokutzneria multivorans TaxID=1142134 RepID=A0ABP7R0E3_9PSEU